VSVSEAEVRALGWKSVEQYEEFMAKPKPIVVKVSFADGDWLLTSFNGSLAEAERYYLGNVFNLGVVEDRLVEAVSVELVPVS
jgi:uncharacterized protein YbcI